MGRGLTVGVSLALSTLAACTGGGDGDRPNVVLITLDTTRADRLGCYGYGRPTSPNLDRLAADSVVYTRAVAPSSWTLPSHASLFTSKVPTSHGARYDPAGPLSLSEVSDAPRAALFRARGLSESNATLATILRDAGYSTGAIVAGPWMKPVFGLGRGFEHYDDRDIRPTTGRLAEEVTEAATAWIRSAPQPPFLLFLNYYDPHGPYSAPAPWGEKFLPSEGPAGESPAIGDLYDGEILYTDHHLGRFLDELRDRGLYDDALIVVTSDHGELLGEHGRVGHGAHLSEPELHVPLIVKFPAGAVPPGRDDRRIALIDVLPLILEQTGLPPPAGAQGQPRSAAGRPILAEVYPLPWSSPDGDWRALYHGNLKYLWNSKGNHLLFDLESDPAESTNLWHDQPELARAMQSRLESRFGELPPAGEPPAGEVDAETIELLRSLGYIE